MHLSGFLLIDKEPGWTSHDIVAKLRTITGVGKIGHAGTLDPFASGLLIVGVGREATKRLSTIKDLSKTYEAVIFLGATSNTQDCTGRIVQVEETGEPSSGAVEKVIQSFIGQQPQTPPMYSAKKVGGKRLYHLARQGKTIERAPHNIVIYDVSLLSYNFPRITVSVKCSPGTYIRTLAADIGDALGCGAYCERLRRTHIGTDAVKNAHTISGVPKIGWQELLMSPSSIHV
jgi:tRNA pseudouridine55 synthase